MLTREQIDKLEMKKQSDWPDCPHGLGNLFSIVLVENKENDIVNTVVAENLEHDDAELILWCSKTVGWMYDPVFDNHINKKFPKK